MRLRKLLRRRRPASLKARMSVVERGMRDVTGRQQYVSLASAAVFIDEERDAKRNVLRTMAPACSVSWPRKRCWARSFIRPAW
ncbi:hypothetical protein CSZ94_15475 [Janthinobacterium sp. ROICE36]|uniref:hypothetical protein n=1 Tax=Janthinobacterium sp. ROICE36 TaxID=2048670 RepID=UPI000C7EFE77|nr:hypothetical protein [Janthinobacterium sp. ROICE36]PLY41537.1 hypothetical protein CSZ94_15475 [Janthinobacterium sp. ROICE36]